MIIGLPAFLNEGRGRNGKMPKARGMVQIPDPKQIASPIFDAPGGEAFDFQYAGADEFLLVD